MSHPIRLATDVDGPAIGRLYRTADWPDHGVDWTRPGIGVWWLVAEAEGGIVGAIQAVASAPYGYIGDIIVHPAYRTRQTENGDALTGRLGTVAFNLLVTACVVLRNAGSQMVMGVVGKDVDALRKVGERYGFLNLGEYTLMARRLG